MSKSAPAVLALLGSPLTEIGVASFIFDAAGSASTTAALLSDARDSYYNALLSFVEAVRGLDAGLYSWSTVKLYYSTFYSIQSLLASESRGLLHITFGGKKKGKPYSYHARAGTNLKKESISSSHEFAFAQFSRHFPRHFLNSSPIGPYRAFDWLRAAREITNYRESPFPEPNAPVHMNVIASRTIRKLLALYLEDNTGLHVFDPDHAIVAFPLKALQFALDNYRIRCSICFSEEQEQFLLGICRDRSGPFSKLVSLSKLLAR
jgi:hypothetical protein